MLIGPLQLIKFRLTKLPVGSLPVPRLCLVGLSVWYPTVPQYSVTFGLLRSSVRSALALCPVLSPVGSELATRSRSERFLFFIGACTRLCHRSRGGPRSGTPHGTCTCSVRFGSVRAGSPVRYPHGTRYPVKFGLFRSGVQSAPVLCLLLSPVGSDPSSRSVESTTCVPLPCSCLSWASCSCLCRSRAGFPVWPLGCQSGLAQSSPLWSAPVLCLVLSCPVGSREYAVFPSLSSFGTALGRALWLGTPQYRSILAGSVFFLVQSCPVRFGLVFNVVSGRV